MVCLLSERNKSAPSNNNAMIDGRAINGKMKKMAPGIINNIRISDINHKFLIILPFTSIFVKRIPPNNAKDKPINAT